MDAALVEAPAEGVMVVAQEGDVVDAFGRCDRIVRAGACRDGVHDRFPVRVEPVPGKPESWTEAVAQVEDVLEEATVAIQVAGAERGVVEAHRRPFMRWCRRRRR